MLDRRISSRCTFPARSISPRPGLDALYASDARSNSASMRRALRVIINQGGIASRNRQHSVNCRQTIKGEASFFSGRTQACRRPPSRSEVPYRSRASAKPIIGQYRVSQRYPDKTEGRLMSFDAALRSGNRRINGRRSELNSRTMRTQRRFDQIRWVHEMTARTVRKLGYARPQSDCSMPPEIWQTT